jgi:hypothetical protein
MTLAASFTGLYCKLGHFEQSLENLLWAVVQGQPETGEGHVLLDRYEMMTSDLIGLVREAREAAEDGREGTQTRLDLARTRQALVACQGRLNQVSGRFYSELVSFEWIDALNNLARERGSQWAKWVQGVRDALNLCPQPLYDVGQALFSCWQDLTEQAHLLAVPGCTGGPGQDARVLRIEPDQAPGAT